MSNGKSHEGWVADLSDGTTVFESVPIPGERTPWQQLLQYCRNQDIKVTGLHLQGGGVTINAMPQKMCDGYFQAREAVRILYAGKTRHLQGIGSIVGDQIFTVWLEKLEDGSIFIRSDIRSLDSNRIHTTL